MTSPSAPPLDHGWMLHGRARLNLAMRLAARAHSALSVAGAAQGRGRRVALVASTVADIAVVRRLRRSTRPELDVHAAADLADLALWTALSTRPGVGQLATSVGVGHPLAIEAGARHGWLGLGVPVASYAVAAAINRVRGRPTPPDPFAWQVAAALGGIGLARYGRRLRRRRLAAHERQLAAELDRIELNAANELALGLDNLLDEVQRAEALVRLGASVTTAGAPWKAELAEETRRSHRYLVDVLVGWQRRHNRTPDLREVVDLAVSPALAHVVLRAEDARALERRLDALGLRGVVPVEPVVGRAVAGRGDDATIAVDFGGHRLDIETGREAVRLAFDPMPGGFAWLALWLAAAGPQDGVPPLRSLGPATVALGLMIWTHRRGATSPEPARDEAVLASTLLTIAAAVIQTRAAGAPRTDPAIPRVPVSLALRGHAFVTALARPTLSRGALGAGVAGGAGAAALAWALTPRPRPVRELAAEMAWVAMSATMARAFTEGIERDGAELEAWVARADEARRAESARHGRRRALDAVDRALAEAERLYATYAGRLEPEVCAEAQRRLERCRRRLTEEMAGG